MLFPDANLLDKWNQKARTIPTPYPIIVFDLLEKMATEDQKRKGFDLADYLVVRDESTGLALKNSNPIMWDIR